MIGESKDVADFSNAVMSTYLNGIRVLTDDKDYFFIWEDIQNMHTVPIIPITEDALLSTLAMNVSVCEHVDEPVNYKSNWVERK